jgi:hypothetical protein
VAVQALPPISARLSVVAVHPPVSVPARPPVSVPARPPLSVPARTPLSAGLLTRRNVNAALNMALPILLAVSFITGWIASLLGLAEFGLHKWSSIAVFVVAFGHLGLHWRSFKSQIRRVRGSS